MDRLFARDAAREYDQGLRTYTLKVYNYMGAGLGVAGLFSLLLSLLINTGQMAIVYALLYNPISALLLMLAPIGILLYLSYKGSKMSLSRLKMFYWIFVSLMGLSLSTMQLYYSLSSFANALFITAASFGGLSLYGYTTKRNLSGFSAFLTMGVIGLVIAMVVQLFLQSSTFQMIIAVVGVLIFGGLTAYETQNMRDKYYQIGGAQQGSEVLERMALNQALSLYLTFVNLFQFILMLTGVRRD